MEFAIVLDFIFISLIKKKIHFLVLLVLLMMGSEVEELIKKEKYGVVPNGDNEDLYNFPKFTKICVILVGFGGASFSCHVLL